MQNGTRLSGLKEIAAYYRCSENKVLALIRTEGFPAVKIGGTWESDKILINKWHRRQIEMSGSSLDQEHARS